MPAGLRCRKRKSHTAGLVGRWSSSKMVQCAIPCHGQQCGIYIQNENADQPERPLSLTKIFSVDAQADPRLCSGAHHVLQC